MFKNNFRILISLLAIYGVMIFSSCEKVVKKDNPTQPRITVNNIIVTILSSSEANVDSVSQGATVSLTAEVTAAADLGDLTFKWFEANEKGTFSSITGDTVNWKAPDDIGAYTIGVIALDIANKEVGMGTRPMGVGMYSPTVTPYYVGGTNCSGCHSDKYGEWEETGHADAWATLQESGHPASYCNRCHTVDNAEVAGNSGYDDAPIELYENVQCESCHGPASAHTPSPSPATITVSWGADNCAQCHEGTHHPFFSEWEDSPHNFSADGAHGAPTNGGCQGCHEGVGAAERLSDEEGFATFYGGAPYGTPARDTSDVGIKGIVCVTCHDPHSVDNPHQLRTVADVHLVTANGESPVIDIGGSGKLCMQCHHARRDPDSQVENGYDHFGPHANPQADMMAGKSAYHGVADPGFAWAGPSHLKVQNSCKTCHLNTVEYTSEAVSAVTGHKFLPTVEACANCHGAITDFDDIMALEDFDGDEEVEGVQSEVQGLLNILHDALIASGVDTSGGLELAEALGDTLLSTEWQRAAGYNWVFIVDDKSMGIHNPDYAVQLLQQSIQYLEGQLGPIGPSIKYAVRGPGSDRRVVADF